jgi:hypothetical protein
MDDPLSSARSSEAELSDSACELADVQSVRKLRRELEREKHRNSQLQAQLKRQTQLQGQLVRKCRPALLPMEARMLRPTDAIHLPPLRCAATAS